jgi:hypothetical protein
MAPTTEALQKAILETLDASADGAIADSRELQCGGATLSGPQDQLLVKSAIDSLESKEVIGLAH